MNYTKGSKRRQRRAQKPTEQQTARPDRGAERPTPERRSRGVWTEPKGMGKHDIPTVDLASDMVGYLLHKQVITSSQEQAARTFQAARAAYLTELPEIGKFKSCLTGEIPGYDDGDGDPEIIARYREIEKALGWRARPEILWVCEDNQPPRNVEMLRWGLDAIGEM